MERIRHPYRVQIALIGLYGLTGISATTLVWVLRGPSLAPQTWVRSH